MSTTFDRLKLTSLAAVMVASGCGGAQASSSTSAAPIHPTVAAAEIAPPPARTAVAPPIDAPLPAGPLGDVVRISAGASQTCAVLRDGRVVCWGENGVGQAGAPLATSTVTLPHLVRGLSEIVDVAAGSFHTCALDRHAHAWCWGSLGLGVTESTVTSVLPRNADTANVGTPVLLQDKSDGIWGVRSLNLAIADQKGCAVLKDEALCWSTQDIAPNGHLAGEHHGWPAITKSAVSANVVCALVGAAPGGHARVECTRERDAPTAIAWPAGAADPIDLSFGPEQLCVLDAGGTVLCWWKGVDARWWQKPGRKIDRLPGGGATAIAVGADFACAIAKDGTVGCFLEEGPPFNDEMSQTAWASHDTHARAIPRVDHAVAITAGMGRNVFGHGYACVIRSDASVVCWGDGESGQLGDGHTMTTSPAVSVIVP